MYGDAAAVSMAARAIVRIQATAPSAVTTPTSSEPSSGDAPSNASTPPNSWPTLPIRMQLALPRNHFLPSTSIFASNGFTRTLLAPVHT